MKQYGFTLMELLVSLSIFVVITGTIIVNFQVGNYQAELGQSARLVANYIRQAQSRSLAGYTVNGVQADGYGVLVQATGVSFDTYADQDADRTFDAGELVQTFGLQDDVSFTTDRDVFFSIPTADVYIDGVQASSAIVLTLQHAKNNRSVDVTILPFSGQVSVGDSY